MNTTMTVIPMKNRNIDDVTRFLALFISKAKEENQLSQQTINAMIENTGDIVERSLEALKKNIRSCLKDNDIEIADVEGLSDVLEQPSSFSQAKEPLTNEYLQVRYFVENFNFVVRITSYLLHLVQRPLLRCKVHCFVAMATSYTPAMPLELTYSITPSHFSG